MERRTTRRIRDIQAAIIALAPAGTVRNVRFRPAGARLCYFVFRVEGADGVDVGRLAARFRDCLFYVCEGALDVYVPSGIITPVALLRAAGVAALAVAACSLGLGLWTVHAST